MRLLALAGPGPINPSTRAIRLPGSIGSTSKAPTVVVKLNGIGWKQILLRPAGKVGSPVRSTSAVSEPLHYPPRVGAALQGDDGPVAGVVPASVRWRRSSHATKEFVYTRRLQPPRVRFHKALGRRKHRWNSAAVIHRDVWSNWGLTRM
jgi:hypothetical protein